jgi:tripartite-type tricarboxylate transporter receptor subunit TctC
MAGQVHADGTKSIPQAAQYVKGGQAARAGRHQPRTQRRPARGADDDRGGLKDFEVVGFYGVLAPAGTPKAAIDKLSAAFKATLETPELRSRMVTQGADPAFLGAEDFTKFLAAEMPRWAQVVKASGTRLD